MATRGWVPQVPEHSCRVPRGLGPGAATCRCCAPAIGPPPRAEPRVAQLAGRPPQAAGLKHEQRPGAHLARARGALRAGRAPPSAPDKLLPRRGLFPASLVAARSDRPLAICGFELGVDNGRRTRPGSGAGSRGTRSPGRRGRCLLTVAPCALASPGRARLRLPEPKGPRAGSEAA